MGLKTYSICCSLAILLSIISIPADAEQEPNDSLDHPQTIYEGEVTGNVSTTLNITDMDIFKLTSPPDCVIFYLFKKTDLGPGELKFRYFDSFQSSIYQYYFDNTFSLSTPGEIKTDSFTNLESEDSMFIKVEGDGQYLLKVHIVPLPESDPPTYLSDEIELENDMAKGMVYRLEWEEIEIEDRDVYYKETSAGKVKATIHKTDDGQGKIKMFLGQSYYSISDSEDYVEVSIEDPTGTVSIEMDYLSDRVCIMIEGEGNYTLTVEEETDLTMVSVLGGTMLVLICIMLVPFLPIIIIIIIVIVFISKNKKKKEQMTSTAEDLGKQGMDKK